MSQINKAYIKQNVTSQINLQQQTKKKNKRMQNFFWYSIEKINLSLNELKLFAKSRGIKDYKNKSEDELIKKIQQTKTKNKIF